MGFTEDGVPLAGPLVHLEGQYIVAGFTGHGMPRAFAVSVFLCLCQSRRLTSSLKCRSRCWDDFSKTDRFRMEDTRVAPGTLSYGLGTLDRVFGTIILIVVPVSIALRIYLKDSCMRSTNRYATRCRKGSEKERCFSLNHSIS